MGNSSGTEDEQRLLMRAARRGLEFNAPMNDGRANDICAYLTGDPGCVVDLGCGYGGLALRLAARTPAIPVWGVDSDVDAIAFARAVADEDDRTRTARFVVGDVLDVGGLIGDEIVDAAVCIGASHAWENPQVMFDHLWGLRCPLAVVGDAIWMQEPPAELVDMFGALPVNLDALEALAVNAGWRVVDASTSTMDEWDLFEGRWAEELRSIGTETAHAFADERWADYQRYRSTLGFGWLHLQRPPAV